MDATPAVYLDHFSLALGDERRTVEESAAAGRLASDVESLRSAGFERHHLARRGATSLDLARAAVHAIGAAADEVHALVYATCLPQSGNVGDATAFARTRDVKHLMDFPASRLQAERGWDDALVLGLSQQGCAGLVGAIRVAASLVRTEPGCERAVCLVADRFPEGALYEQAYNVMSDGAAACVVSRNAGGFKLLAGWGLTNGALAHVTDDEAVGSFFGYACRVADGTLGRLGLDASAVDWLVPQNMNRRALEVLARLLRVDPGRVLAPSLPDVGHLVCGDNLENVRRGVEAGLVRAGDRLLVLMVGYGLNWQALLLERV